MAGPAVTIAAPDWTFDAQLEQDRFGMLWLNAPNITGRCMGRYLLSAMLKIGWRIRERVLLEQHPLVG